MTRPDLPSANLELRRLLDAGSPPDGNTLPLMRALVASQLVVPRHPQGGPLRMARRNPERPDRELVVLHAFTSFEQAARWGATVRDAAPDAMSVAPCIAICKLAIAQGVDLIEIDSGTTGYRLYFRGMVDVLSRVAFDGEKSVVFEEVKIGYGVPKTMPPAAILDEITRLGRASGLTELSWCMGWMGDAPGEMQLVFAPYSAKAFAEDVRARMNELTGDRFTFCTHDAEAHRLPVEHLQRLIG